MNSTPAINEIDKDAVESFKEMLSFFAVELQSHAAMILGLTLLIFALVQTWGQLQASGAPSPVHVHAFSLFMGIVGAGIVHQIWRLYAFGKLASALMYASDGVFDAAKNEWNKSHPPEASWDHLFALAKVSVYSERMLWKNAQLWIKLKVLQETNQRARLHPWVLIASFVVWFTLSYGLVFGVLDLLYLAELAVVLGSILSLAYLVRARLLRRK